jgi:hypothetical protein
MHAVRRGDFGKGRDSEQVKGDTARKALDHVAATFVESGRPSPIVDTRGKTHVHIERQTRGYKRDDPSTKHEKALPPIVFKELLKNSTTNTSHPRSTSRAYLICGALFFAMRSCEYTYIGTRGERKTRPIRVCDIVFRMGHRVIPHSSMEIFHAEDVSIDFGDQKSDIKDETVSQDSNNNNDGLNPVTLWAFTIQRLRSYPGFREDWEVYKFYDHDSGKLSNITSKEILIDIRAAVDAIGPDILGFTSDDVGTHSVRSSLAMMMYLAKEAIYTIMLVGRWSSDAFLAYIEKQIKEFTRGVSSRMLQYDTFYNIPLANTSHQERDTSNTHGRSHHRRALLGNIYGRQGSLRHQLCPRN